MAFFFNLDYKHGLKNLLRSLKIDGIEMENV